MFKKILNLKESLEDEKVKNEVTDRRRKGEKCKN